MATTHRESSARSTNARAATAAAAVSTAVQFNRQRIPQTVDFLGQSDATLISTLQPFRLNAVNKVYLGLQQIQTSLSAITGALSAQSLPARIIGALQQPNGSAANQVQISFDPTTVGGNPPPITVVTGDAGEFTLPMPTGKTLPASGLALTVHGANANATVTIPASQIAANGVVGVVPLPSALSPLPVSILASLQALLPPTFPNPNAPPPANAPQLPGLKVGKSGPCLQQFNSGNTVDKFPFNVFVRLVEPHLSIVNQVQPIQIAPGLFVPLPIYLTGAQNQPPGASATDFTDRVPVEQPLSVDGFRDQIMGYNATQGVFDPNENVPMAATLGLGYVLELQQQWTFAGVSLGDLVYSLPLAPGEQQEVAIFERTDTSQVTESEFFSESQASQQTALADTSTLATFNSAFNEVASGGSSFQTSSSNSSSSPFLGGIFGGSGGGGSSSSGNNNNWLQGQTNQVQNAAETTHSASMNQASARRTAARTGMRLASASEQESVVTKTITNHNHAHALTMQYWEVLRNYSTTTVIDGLTMCCLVPMQIVRFMPPFQPLTISAPSQLSTRPEVLGRYVNIIKQMDVLQQAVPRPYQYGLSLLAQFAADPTATVEPAGGVAEDVIAFSLTGSFLPCETISIQAVTRRNTRVGPVVLAPTSGGLIFPPTPPTYLTTQDQLVAYLLNWRQTGSVTYAGNLALPPSMNRTDIIGFEIIRNFNTLSFTLASPNMATAAALPGILGAIVADVASNEQQTVTLSPNQLENALAGPNLTAFSAAIIEYDLSGNPLPASGGETYANETLNGVELPPQPYPVPALQVAPVLRFSEILEIEKAAHHIVRNTTRYSKAVWSSLMPEERAILLDAYTIGVPTGGVQDASQMVPLLNCVENRLLGFFGNSMVLPFIIPPGVLPSTDNGGTDLDQGAIEAALLAYQQQNFVPPTAMISLPTRGVLGEAVLGHCPSAEKIDLTRFWNWQDSASDAAPTISPVTLPTTSPSLTTGLTAPNSLSNLPSLINNVQAAPTPNTSLLQSLVQAAAAQQGVSPTLTGAQQLASLIQGEQNTANAARADAFNTTKALTSQLIGVLGNIASGGSGGGGGGGSSNGSGSSDGSGSSGGAGSSSGGSSAIASLLPILIAALA